MKDIYEGENIIVKKDKRFILKEKAAEMIGVQQ